MTLTLWSVLGTLFLLLDCLDQRWDEGFCIIVLYFVVLCLVVVSWRPALF